MTKINVAPTRSNLIRIRKELQFSKEGYEILNRKREVLTTELIQMAHKAEELQREVWSQLAEAYAAMEKAQLNMGTERVEWAALAANKTVEVQLKFRGIMGVSIPMIESKGAPLDMLYSLGDTNSSLDEASSGFVKVTKMIPELSMVMTTVWRLATELRKTQRRVNALQYIFIPEYEETVSFIVSSLEEREREDTFMLKMLKNRTKKKQEAENAKAA
ncbi:MAG: V-type ATP synthase subunit D [Chloroflexi bacterium HGW-Chloroflexi-5]|jgi:V/A-type H+-transporting ATPase subunit D|nr:MAG: V-type ATP synthase subunit D [Chloroflexi bacterium HGW-Chloroflexi-5]